MPNEHMTLIERLRNPQWEPVGNRDSGVTVLNVEVTLKTMREAADRLERLGGQRVSKFSYAENLKSAILKAADLFQKPGDNTLEIEKILCTAMASKHKPQAGDWLDIGGESQYNGWGAGRIEVRISNGGDTWEWRSLTKEQNKWLVGLANTDPEGRDRGCA